MRVRPPACGLPSACSWRAFTLYWNWSVCALAGADVRPRLLRRRASRPHLKRDPLGSSAGADVHALSPLVPLGVVICGKPST